MVRAKTLWKKRLNTLVFTFLLLSLFSLAAACSLMPLPLLTHPLYLHFYGALSFVALLYLPPKFWPFVMIPGFWLDMILQLPGGTHLIVLGLQYGCIFLMRSFLKEYRFLSNWGVFAASYGILFTLLTPFQLSQTYLTILIYPFVLTWFLKFLFSFKQVHNG